MSFNIIDLHCDTMMACYFENKAFKDFSGHINIEKLKQGGSMMQALALFIATNGKTARDGVTSPWDLYKAMLACWKKEIAANSDSIRQVFSAEDIKKNVEEGYLSAFLSVEDSIGVDGKMERLQEMYDDGVRMLTLTWNYENSVGYPCSEDPDLHQKGLKPFGIECLKFMNEKGMIIDVSHLSEGGFYDVSKYSTKPFVASHSCARALCSHQRNLTDDQLKTLADKGGVVGINFYSKFLEDGSTLAKAEDIVKHLVYMKDKAGIDALAWGSDFDGIECELDFGDYSGFPKILNILSKYFTDDEIDKINHGNFLRIMQECLK